MYVSCISLLFRYMFMFCFSIAYGVPILIAFEVCRLKTSSFLIFAKMISGDESIMEILPIEADK